MPKLKQKNLDRITIWNSPFDVINRETGELVDGAVTFTPAPKTPNKHPYHRFFKAPIDMMSLMYLHNLTKTEFEIMLLLMHNSVKNNAVVFNEELYAKALEVSQLTIKRSMINLRKNKLIKRLKLLKPHILFQISPHMCWMGDTESLEIALKDWEFPKVPSDRFDLFKDLETHLNPVVKSQRKHAFYENQNLRA